MAKRITVKRKRRRVKGSTSVDLGSGTKAELRTIIRQGSGSPTGIPMTRAIAAIVRKFRRLQEMADENRYLHVAPSGLTFDLNLD